MWPASRPQPARNCSVPRHRHCATPLLCSACARQAPWCLGKTNMTEFAFAATGVNPHYGTPGNATDAISLPMPEMAHPAGLMLVARNGHDRRLLRIAAEVEALLGY